MARRWAWLLVVALLAAGCAKMLPSRQADRREAYQDTIKANLVKGSLYKGPATVALAKALPLNKTVAAAVAARLAAATARPVSAFARPKGRAFILSLYLPEADQNNLELPRPTWRVFLENRGGKRLPPRDRRLEKPLPGMAEELYPFHDAWSRLYRLSFAGPVEKPLFYAGSRTLKLVLVGPGGELKLAFPAAWN